MLRWPSHAWLHIAIKVIWVDGWKSVRGRESRCEEAVGGHERYQREVCDTEHYLDRHQSLNISFLEKKNLSSRPFFLKIRSVFKRQSSQNVNQMVEKSIYHCFLSLIPSCKPNNINTTFILVIAHSAVGLLYVVKWLPSGSQRSWRPPLGTLN